MIRAPALCVYCPFRGQSIYIFLFSLVYIALGAIPGSPQLRILTALYDLFTSREFIYSVCNFVDALVAIYQLRVLVRYVCTRYVCTPSLSPPSPRGRIGRLLPFGGGYPATGFPRSSADSRPRRFVARTFLFYRKNFIYHQQLTFCLSGNQQQNQKHIIELFLLSSCIEQVLWLDSISRLRDNAFLVRRTQHAAELAG